MTQASTPVIAIATTAEVIMTMGSWKGTASQLSLPHMSVPLPGCFGCLRGAPTLGRRPGAGWEFLSQHFREKLRRHCSERRGGQVRALPRERHVGGVIERRADSARRLDPRGEVVGAHGPHREVHVGEAIAT